MDAIIRKNKYDRVMSRLQNRSRTNLNSNSFVTRHDWPSSVRLVAKPSVSNLSSSVFGELPIVLNDYVPESCGETKGRKFVKPRKTIPSLDPASSPPRITQTKITSGASVGASAPSVLVTSKEKRSYVPSHKCLSARSPFRLKQLKDEIKAFHETDRLMKTRSHLYKSCGIVLDDVGNVAEDKAVQADVMEAEGKDFTKIRSGRLSSGPNARATVPHEQMRAPAKQYPVDRYLVESSKKLEMVNIIDEVWNTEPTLRPEDEIILRKLHEMLQSTADDLKLLSGELSKFHDPGVQVQMTPTPLDEEFNEKVHIEEVVNAKFHGYKIIENMSRPEQKQRNNIATQNRTVPVIPAKVTNKFYNTTHPKVPPKPKVKNLEMTRPRLININGNKNGTKTETLNNGKVVTAPLIAYNQFSHKYAEPKIELPRKMLNIQAMPSINIRSELKPQKVLQLDILPDNNETQNKSDIVKKNVSVIAVQHDDRPRLPNNQIIDYMPVSCPKRSEPIVRKVSKLSTGESSESTNKNNSDTSVKLKTQKYVTSNIKRPKNTIRSNGKTEPENQSHLQLDEWKRKLNSVYGTAFGHSRKNKYKSKTKPALKKAMPECTSNKTNILNNTEYIPYSKLTVGGVRASDIEKEISNISNRNEIPLSPLLERILSSRENSFNKSTRQKRRVRDSPKIFTTSDENLLQEVIDIERTVSETLSKDLKKSNTERKGHMEQKDNDDDSYVDDFEDDRSSDNISNNTPPESAHNSHSDETNKADIDNKPPSTLEMENHNRTYTKPFNLSFKDSVDVFEFVHSVDTQDNATQIHSSQKITPKETQTSPRNSINMHHNDLWPAADPIAEVEKMFKIEKELIKNLIIEEYGDLLEKNVSKPSTSKETHNMKNVTSSQKNTQTSPAHTKHVMTSPTNTKTRTTSPFAALAVNSQTSPLIFVTNENEINVEIDGEEDLGISINLSSPRFCLRLPQTSREVLQNLEVTSQKLDRIKPTKVNNLTSSTSSVDADSSEISSLGEITYKIRSKFRSDRFLSSSESTCSSSTVHSIGLQSGILPLRSEGEMSVDNKKPTKSEGETSGQF